MKNVDRAGMTQNDGYWLLVVFFLLAIIAGLISTSCQTVHGLALDVESAARYTADHTKVDR